MKIDDIKEIKPMDLSLIFDVDMCMSTEGEEMNPGFCDEGLYPDENGITISRDDACRKCRAWWPVYARAHFDIKQGLDRKFIYVFPEDQIVTTKDGKTYLMTEVDVSKTYEQRKQERQKEIDRVVAELNKDPEIQRMMAEWRKTKE